MHSESGLYMFQGQWCMSHVRQILHWLYLRKWIMFQRISYLNYIWH